MSRIGGRSDIPGASNVVRFRPRSAETDTKASSRSTQKVQRKKVSPYDADDAEAVGRTVTANFESFVSDPEQVELFGFVIDGKTFDQRNASEADSMNNLTNLLRTGSPGSLSKQTTFKSGDFDDQMLSGGQPVRAFTTMRSGEKPTVYLSNQLGFRDSILAARDAYSDITVKAAVDMGISVASGDLGSQVSQTVSTSLPPETGYNEEPPSQVRLIVDGKSVLGTPR